MFEVVAPLWARLERSGARHRILTAARRELATLTAWMPHPKAAEWLADRLMRHLTTQGGPETVCDPVGWLLKRGLPARTGCSDVRCIEGIRMDTGQDCPSCAYLVADRRALRKSVAEQVGAEMPQASAADRKAVYEQRLCEVTARQQAEIRSRHQAAAKLQERQHAAARERAREAATVQERQAQPCAGCGVPGTAGECHTCAEHHAAEQLLEMAGTTAAGAWADVTDPQDIEAVRVRVRETFDSEFAGQLAVLKDRGATDTMVASFTRLLAESAVGDYRRSALAILARTPHPAGRRRGQAGISRLSARCPPVRHTGGSAAGRSRGSLPHCRAPAAPADRDLAPNLAGRAETCPRNRSPPGRRRPCTGSQRCLVRGPLG
ncbi:hypothetical protein OIE63_39555 (plasmid) [Streptomyces sp. NBC_01795]|uniref:hypothetical protein n=1 Tax=unclassified Streptomyces TaxID=2593676 RepID=UPI002DD968B3|nr:MULTISPECIES: hypothetical protein [unclassified Streptomyces]WSA97616.1 hypothetical protein OIE63_39555 [Streptomyces sp. NBC_01795]WSB82134.1 hypothetical protein OHB04_41260 [Streptomyces sp. NBC_01775]WSS18105.1 hypothetical protein OG533_40340 [Streptomyces sp. NBC_01186]